MKQSYIHLINKVNAILKSRNHAKCRNCKDFIISLFTHDMVYCICKSIAVDGGTDYNKRTGEQSNFVKMSVEEICYQKSLLIKKEMTGLNDKYKIPKIGKE